jgi:winged helix DNA-binding protein
VLTLRELNRALLERQLLLKRRRLAVPRAVERLCALQAQYSLSPYIGLWSRLSGFCRDQLTQALEERQIVKSTLFRITLHMTSARDYPYFAAAFLPAAREATPRVTAEALARLSRKVNAAAQKPLTHERLEALAAEEMGGRWRTRTLAPLIHLPPSGTWRFHGRPELLAMEAWLGVSLPSREEGAKHVVRSYLSAFGPATQEDLLRFTGVRLGDLRPGLDALELRRFRDERGRLLLDLPRAPLPDGDTAAPIRFLPKWDSSLLAYAPPERTRILPEDFRGTVIRKNGDVLPTVLVDGFVAATWNVDRKRGLELETLRRLTRAERAEIEEEGERLVQFVRD